MKRFFAGGTCVAVALAFGVVASAQQPQPQQPPTSSPSVQASGQQTTAAEVTIAGCVQRETDYRRANNLGGGGAAGTGVGAGNEFVLVNASMSRAAGSTPSATPEPAGTTGAAGAAYELTGSGEGKASEFVGKRVEVVGKLKPAEAAAGGATGGPTAGAPPRGVDVASKDLKLRELDVTSIREASGTCPTMENK